MGAATAGTSTSWHSGGLPSDLSLGLTEEGSICGSTLVALDRLRESKVLCDVTLISNDGMEFKGHKAVFAAASSFFRGLFTHDGKYPYDDTLIDDGKSKMIEEFEVDTDSDLLQMIVDFSYTGNVTSLGFLQVEQLLPVADRLNIGGLVDICVRFLLERLEPANCVGIWQFAQFYSCPKLETAALKCILYNVRALAFDGKSSEFFGTTPEELQIILDHDLLNLQGEDEVVSILKRWVQFDFPNRSLALPDLLGCLRYGLCPRKFIYDTLPEWSMSIGFEDGVIEGIQREWELTEGRQQRYPTLHEKFLRPRIPQDVLFSLGGWTEGAPTGAIETYDPKADRWFPAGHGATHPRCDTAYHGLAVHDQKIFVVGGFDGTDYYNSVRIYDPLSGSWKEAAPMYIARCYVSVVVLDGWIYAIGGFDGRVRLSSAERYDPGTNQWSLIQPMNRRRSDSSATTLKGRIFVAGGFNGNLVLSSVEVYTPATDHWVIIADMLTPRSGVSISAHNGRVYAVGGFDGLQRLASVECYDPEALCWVYAKPLYTPRSNFALCSLEGALYAIGGFDGTTTISGVERMNGDETWTPVRDMAINRSAVKACVVSGLEDTRPYGFHGHAMHA